MEEDYEVQAGDCISSIAYERGFSLETIWNHPANAALKQRRRNPYVLRPGDVLKIPDKTEHLESCQTEKRHTFKLKGVPAKLRVRLVDHEDLPRANLPYTLSVDGQTESGQTDDDGLIERIIPPNARTAVLRFRVNDLPQEYELRLGHLDPNDDSHGIQQRLTNLGYGFVAGEGSPPDERTTTAAFQRKAGLDPTGEPDAATRQKLTQLHGV
jgi:N-acetylmuramoyl-L-alanine amidase